MKNIVYVKTQYFVSTSNQGLKFSNVIDKSKQYMAYDDVDTLIFDNVNGYLSNKLIQKCVEHEISLIFCDEKHSPLLLLDNLYNQKKRFELLNDQLTVGNKVKNRLWSKIVLSKINNQAQCLEETGHSKINVSLIKSIKNNITEGDKHNVEAYAAREYFPMMFGKNFKRGRYDDIVNASLNYGYSILRALIRKEIVIHGLEPSFGIHHASVENPFNLSDDLIEPYRAFVDELVYESILPKNHEQLDSEDREDIVKILFEKCVIDNKVYCLGDAIKVTVNSYLNCLNNKSSSNLKLPTFIEGGK